MARRVTWSAIAAVIVIGFILFVLMASQTLVPGDSGAQGGPEMTRAELRSLALGSSRDDIERSVGRGTDALEFSDVSLGATGEAVEPMDATCVYYSLRGGFGPGPIQLCYQGDELVSKRLYP